MKISLAVVGKIGKSFLNAGIDEYTRRLSHYVSFDIQYIGDAKNTKSLSEKQQKQQEGVNILASLDSSDYVVLLDLAGKEMDSVKLSEYIDRIHTGGCSRITFVIGGSLGLSKEVIARADTRWKLSPNTFPHQLCRIIVLEQIYRAFRILHHEPYHK